MAASVRFAADPRRELRPRPNAQLLVDALQVRLDGARAHEQRVGGLLVGPALGDEGRDLLLRVGQLERRGAPAANPCQLRFSSVRPETSASTGEDVAGGVELLSRDPLLLRPAVDLAENEPGTGYLEREIELLEQRDRAARRSFSPGEIALCRGEKCAPARRHRDRPRPAASTGLRLEAFDPTLGFVKPPERDER